MSAIVGVDCSPRLFRGHREFRGVFDGGDEGRDLAWGFVGREDALLLVDRADQAAEFG